MAQGDGRRVPRPESRPWKPPNGHLSMRKIFLRKVHLDVNVKKRYELAELAALARALASHFAAVAQLVHEVFAAVGRALSAQMTFFKGLKDGTKAISFALAGVQPDAFRAAFGDGAGLTRTVAGAALGIDNSEAGPLAS